ncbi:hypothetical protein [Neopusillimonas aromaticivorans]|uniref:hypothetical protein n=1 Tax=Neopusillimonas aromaticivorans TaxID=2979868 RepID=UPI0025944F86|nr:hypothetical protein [Neopusillimonas aromaticivorans]WJJ93197.1 hypothetical protein N7E01_14300 [Neopusillimonas aromaticivorans]
MNAQQTTSVVNLISAQPAKVSASSFSDANAQNFADILGNQRTQQAAPAPQYRSPAPASNNSAAQSGNSAAQSPPTNTQQASSTPAPQASSASTTNTQQATSSAETSQDPTTANGAVASHTSSSGSNDTSSSGAPGTDASPHANKQAVTEDEPAANPVALAMSDLAAAVAQVFMARNASATSASGAEAALVANDTTATADLTRQNGDSLAQNGQALKGFALEDASGHGNQRNFTENSLLANQRAVAEPVANDPRLAVSGRARPASSASSDASQGKTLTLRFRPQLTLPVRMPIVHWPGLTSAFRPQLTLPVRMPIVHWPGLTSALTPSIAMHAWTRIHALPSKKQPGATPTAQPLELNLVHSTHSLKAA